MQAPRQRLLVITSSIVVLFTETETGKKNKVFRKEKKNTNFDCINQQLISQRKDFKLQKDNTEKRRI